MRVLSFLGRQAALRIPRHGATTRISIPRSRRGTLGIFSGGILLALGGSLYSPVHAESDDSERDTVSLEPPRLSLGTVIRSYIVYSMCSIPLLIDNGPHVLEVLTNIPVVKQITEAFVRVTFFDQVRTYCLKRQCSIVNTYSAVCGRRQPSRNTPSPEKSSCAEQRDVICLFGRGRRGGSHRVFLETEELRLG